MISSGKEYEYLRDPRDDQHREPKTLGKDMHNLCEAVRINLQKAYNRYAANYNLRSNRKISFAEGETVLKKNFYQSDKVAHF